MNTTFEYRGHKVEITDSIRFHRKDIYIDGTIAVRFLIWAGSNPSEYAKGLIDWKEDEA